jgi:Trk-type K+ transport system membrane component
MQFVDIDARNTGFPLLLRLTIYILFRLSPSDSTRKETYAFLLDHPRRCFTLLFPRTATWWLFAVLLVMNLADLIFFLVLDLGDEYVLSIPVGYRILDGLFQVCTPEPYDSVNDGYMPEFGD